MNDKYLLLVYSAFLVSSVFMFFSCARQAVIEALGVRLVSLLRNPYFMLTAGLAVLSIALIGIASLRLIDGLSGLSVGGRWPHEMSVFMTLLWLATVAFQWAGTIGRRRWHWRIFVFVTFVVLAGFAFWLW